MDSVRFGRALGIGARSAAKALAGAAEAASAPNPGRQRSESQARRPASEASPRTTVPRPLAAAAKSAVHASAQVRETRRGIARGGKRFGEAVWGPFAKLSGVLWLEITGFFFGIFALFAGSAIWTHRTAFKSGLAPANHDALGHLLVFVVMALVFGYFCISSFVRAYRR